MKIERLTEYVTITVTILAGMGLSLYVGASAGTGSNTPILLVLGIVCVTIALLMQANIWLLIPLLYPLSGQLYGFPGRFPAHDLVIMYVFVAFLALKALKVVRSKPKFDWLDYLLWLNLFILALAYVRNPIGTNSLGFDKIGGRPYAEVIFAVCGYWVMHHVMLPAKWAHRFPLVMIAGNVFNIVLSMAAHVFPFVANTVGRVYAGAYVAPENPSASPEGAQREGQLLEASSVFNALCAIFPPFSLLNPMRFFRFLFAALCVWGVLRSGFRSGLMGMAEFFLVAAFFRNGFAAVARLACIGAICVVFLAGSQGTLFHLPHNIQRTLSFLPGKWDPEVLDEAQGSIDWRHDIWSNVWKSGDKYIKNWWLGDGFGMTKRDLEEMAANRNESQENLTIAGAYHSLPLTTIHTVGYVGFAFFCVLMFGNTYYGWKLILKTRGTPYYSMGLFIGIPTITGPLPALFLTGFYDLHLIGTILGVGWLRMIRRSLGQYLIEEQATALKPKDFKQGFEASLLPDLPTK